MTNDCIVSIETEWKAAHSQFGAEACRYIPVPVICQGSFADAENIANELSRFIYSEKLLEKISPVHEDILLFYAGYTVCADRSFPAVQELYELLLKAGGYYGSYRGVLLIDVSEWVGHFRDRYFDVFLAYLADLRMDGMIPFFYVDCEGREDELRSLEAVIFSYFRSMRVGFGAEELCEYGVSVLEEHGIVPGEKAREYLEGFVREAQRSHLFHGTESVRRICEEVARNCGADPGSEVMRAGMVCRFEADPGSAEERTGAVCGFGADPGSEVMRAGMVCRFEADPGSTAERAGAVCGFGADPGSEVMRAGTMCRYRAAQEHENTCDGALCRFGAGHVGTVVDGPRLKEIIRELGYADIYADKPVVGIGFR